MKLVSLLKEIDWMFYQFRKYAVAAKAVTIALFLFAASMLTPSHVAWAQSSTDGAIAGTVTDANGALLPNTSITITSTGTGATRIVKANSSGEYRVAELQPGVYSVTFSADGFETAQQKEVIVTVGSISNVSPKLIVGSVADKVEVSDESPLMHTQSNDISTTIDQTAIDNLPINGRRYSDFALLTPGVVSDSNGYGLLSFRGISFLLNNNTIDGADDNQAYFSEARGRTRAAFAVPQSAVQEFQVNTSNYSAQYGRSAGGVINTVTKSGTNKLHGQLFFYDRDNDLGGATNPYTLLTEQNSAGNYYSVPYKPTDWRKEWGFTLGGPIIKDKLFWTYTYDQLRRNYPGTSRPTDPNDIFAPSNATLPTNEGCSTTAFTSTALTLSTEGDYNSCELAALYGVSFQAGSAYYQQGLGVTQTLIGVVPRTQDQVINLPKLDYQINDRNRLSVLYNRMRYSAPNGLYQPTTENEGRSGWGNDFIKEDFGIARLTSVLSNSLANEALVQYGRDFEYTYQNGPLPNEVPLSHNQYGAAAGTQIGYYLSGGFYAGSNPDLPRAADPDERRLQLLDALTWSHGKHTSKFGLEYNKVSDYVNNLYNGNGGYSYDWSYSFIADYLNSTTGVGGPVEPNIPAIAKGAVLTSGGAGTGYFQQYYSFGQEFGNPIGLIATREYAGYATDDWRITPTLTLTLGVRYEYEYVPPSPFINTGNQGLATALGLSLAQTALPQTGNRPDDRNNIAPRVGFAWNVYGDGKTILRGGYGMYFGRIINSNILQTYEESGSPNGQISISNLHPSTPKTPGCGPIWPNIYMTANDVYNCYAYALANNISPGTLATSTVAYLDPHFQNPQVHEADLAIEQSLGPKTTFGVTYMMSLGRELPTAIDTNINPGSTAVIPYVVTPAATSAANTLTSYPISTTSEAATSTSTYPLPAQTGSYVTLPHGGAKTPLTAGGMYSTKVFFQGTGSGNRPNPAYYQILDVKSAVNSSYNALAFQVTHRYDNGFSLLANYTWSHALDENPYESTVVPTFNTLDPTNLRADYGNSNTDVRQRFVGALVYQPQTHFHGIEEYALGGWRISPLVQLQTGLPFSPTISSSGFTSANAPAGAIPGCTSGAGCALLGTGVNGDGSSAGRVPFIDRNSYNYPKTAVFDVRLSKNFYINNVAHLENARFEILAEVFNVMNHQNITGLTTEAYTLAGVNGVPTLTPYQNFGVYTNSNSNYVYSPRQVQIAARFHF